MLRKINWSALGASVAVAEAVGILSSWLSGSGGDVYNLLYKPPGAPPAWVFPLVWVILYALMGAAAYFVWDSRHTAAIFPHISRIKARNKRFTDKKMALACYVLQLGVNFFWSIFFFGFFWYFFALLWLLLLIALVFVTFKYFLQINALAGLMLVPYLIWLVYAAVLNYQFWQLNASF